MFFFTKTAKTNIGVPVDALLTNMAYLAVEALLVLGKLHALFTVTSKSGALSPFFSVRFGHATEIFTRRETNLSRLNLMSS